MSYEYDTEFFDFVGASAAKSARRFIEVVAQNVFVGGQVAAVMDVGCGRGEWVVEWCRRGATRVLGVDGEYVPTDSLLIPRESFIAADLSKPLSAGTRFQLVQCLEVAEHIAPDAAATLIDGLVRHGDVIVFSAAVPGQGGEHHVNERPYAYWRGMFGARGYQMYDAIRPLLRYERDIAPWYRYNTFVYANQAGVELLAPQARTGLLTAAQPIPDIAPLAWRLRCRAIASLPAGIANLAARMKHRLANRLPSS